ncbi:MAG TPA: hydrogenase nickel incorporation protein HypB [Opitutaceae bacterium]|nr:hydrogenase nickel incorporation protein HypB [Opitutaceae bacterium]
MKVLRAVAPQLLRPKTPAPAPLATVAAAAPTSHTVEVHASLLAKNDSAAARNRAVFAAHRLLALNLVSSPGAGKTTLLSRTVDEFGHEEKCAVVVGDLETDNDARRIHRPHVPVAQITTGTACHLDADMVARGVEALDLAGVRVLFIENVGNLVCPASFDLGEAVRVVLLSATEGEDKPLKYPPIFKSAHLVLLTKIDVAGALGFDRAAAVDNIRRIAPQAQLIQLSARSGEGLDEWYRFLRAHLPRA